MKVRITYFKRGGKYYTDAEVDLPLGEDSAVRNGFEVWVKSPEGEVKKLHVDIEFEPNYTAKEIS